MKKILEDLINILCENTRNQFNNFFKFKNTRSLLKPRPTGSRSLWVDFKPVDVGDDNTRICVRLGSNVELYMCRI